MAFKRKKLFIDIDGVLITTKGSKPAEYVGEFIDYVIDNFDCYWLTTHCKGDSKTAIAYLTNHFEEAVIQKLQRVKATNWSTLKTEVFDFTFDFLWLDDYVFHAEKTVLLENNSLDRLIVVDLQRRDELKRVMGVLRNYLTPDFDKFPDR